MIRAIICDIDGTLANCNHRRHLVEQTPKDWPAFYEAMKDDQPIEEVREALRNGLVGRRALLFVTGRPEEYRKVTERWLQNPGYIYDYTALLMRRTGDFRPDTEVKREIYLQRIAPAFQVDLVLDDRASVVAMWRAQGLRCWQVAEGDF